MKRNISNNTYRKETRKRLLGRILTIAAGIIFPAISLADNNQHAELILLSNKVIPMASHRPLPAQPGAIAIAGEKILWVGTADAAAAWTGADTHTVDLGDQAILPGFIDAHGHASFLALSTQLANIASPPVGPVNTIEDLQRTLKDYIAERDIGAGEWVVGLGYDDSLIEEQRHPDRDDLDRVSTQHPILLIHVSGHLAAANSRALARGGISSESVNPAGGIIRRRANSDEPNGVLEETATYELRKYMTSPNKDPLASVQAAMASYASFGITTVQDGAASAEVVDLLRAADAAGKIDLDVIVYPVGQADPIGIPSAYTYGEYVGRVKIGGIKLMLDGSPQGKTAFLTQPYQVPPDGQSKDYRGYPNIPQSRANELVKTYLDHHIPILAHANGDAAAQMLVDAVAAAAPTHDHRTVMIHAQTVREDQLTRMKSLHMIPSYFSAHTYYWGDWHRDSVLGETRAARISPTASTVARGMPFTVHNDAPIVPPDMLRLLWATTNRVTRSGQVLGPEQRISIYDALRAMTSYAAYQHFEENIKGSLEAGKLADIVILDADPLGTEPAALLERKVVATFSRGRQVFGVEL